MKWTMAVVAMLVAPALAMGATMSLVPSGTVVATPGQTLTVDLILSLAPGEPEVAGFQAVLIDKTNSGKLSITSRTFPGLFGDGFPLSVDPRGPLNPKSRELGMMTWVDYPPSMFPANVGRVGLRIDPSWDGRTPIRVGVTDLLLSDGLANPIEIGPGPDLIITPEPASLLLLGLGGLLLRRRVA